MPNNNTSLAQIREYVRSNLEAFIAEKVPAAASLAAKTAITFLGMTIGVFLRELLNNPELQEMIKTRSQDEVNAAIRTALQDLWSKTYDVFFNTLKRGIGNSTLEANYFAERVMQSLQEETKQHEAKEREKYTVDAFSSPTYNSSQQIFTTLFRKGGRK